MVNIFPRVNPVKCSIDDMFPFSKPLFALSAVQKTGKKRKQMLRSVIRLFSWNAREGFKRLPCANVKKTGDRWKKREKHGEKGEKEQKYGERERG